MENSKLISLLKAFSSREWKAFDKYLQSPYLNANNRLVRFYGLLKKHHPAFNPIKLAKPMVFAALFPDKKIYDDRLLRATMADLHKAAESFLVFEKLKQEEHTRSKLLIRSYAERELYPRFERQTDALLEKIKSRPIKNMGGYLDTFLLNKDYYFHPRTEALATSVASLKNAVLSLDQFYAFAKLRLSCELSARSKIVAEETEYPMLEAVQQYIENNSLNNDPAFSIYLDLLKINMEGLNEELFFALKNKYLIARNKLNFLEQKEILVYLLNYAYRLGQSGNNSFFEQQFELYKIGLANELFIENGVLPDLGFTNIAVIGSLLKEWDWTKKFIELYSLKLKPAVQLEASNLAKAYLLFHQKHFQKADILLNSITANKIEYRLRQYTLSIRCLYEIYLQEEDYLDLLLSKINAYEKYLIRQKIFSKSRILSEINLIRFIRKMVAIHQEQYNKQHEWDELMAELNNTNPLAARRWLISKLSKNKQRGL